MGVVSVLLADKRVDPSADESNAMLIAVEKGHEKVVELLLADKRINPAFKNNLYLITAAEKGTI